MKKHKKIAWVTDSTALITEDLKNNPDVYVVPLTIIFENKAYDDGIDLTTEELYRLIKREKAVPKTSQPPVGRFANLFKQLKEDGYDCAIAVHISTKMSGTLASCQAGADLASFPIETVDSKSMSGAITTLIHKGMEAQQAGFDYKEIAKKLRSETEKSENFILLGSLEQFYKGGRMSGAEYLLGSLFRIKPIIKINHLGEFELFERVRTEKKAINRLFDLLQQSLAQYKINEIKILHGNVFERAKKLKDKIKSMYPEIKIIIGEIGATIVVHSGEGTLAAVWHREPK